MARTGFDQLFACPFCGKGQTATHPRRTEFDVRRAAIRCGHCHARGPYARNGIEALKAWASILARINRT